MLWVIALITVIVFAVFMLGAASVDDRSRRENLEDDEDFLFFAEEDTEER